MAKLPDTGVVVTIAGDPETEAPLKREPNKASESYRYNGGARGTGVPVAEDEQRQPTRGEIAFEDGKTSIEGSVESVKPGVYYDQKSLAILKRFVDRLEDPQDKAHYEEVLEDLSGVLTVNEETVTRYEEARADIVERGGDVGKEIGDRLLRSYQDQLRKSIQVFDGYTTGETPTQISDEESQLRLTQERAVLIYAEFLLAQSRIHSIDASASEIGHHYINDRLNTDLEGLNISDTQRRDLDEAFTAMGNYAEFSFLQSCYHVVQDFDSYLSPDNTVARTNHGIALDVEFMDVHLGRTNDRIEGAHRLVISALDRLNEPAHQRWVAQRGQNPEVNLIQNPFPGWQGQIEAQIAQRENLAQARPMESKDYINGILGSRKEESGFFGVKRAHQLKHHIKNVDHKAPIKRPGESRDKLENVQATEIAIMAGVWQGEWNRGATAKEGESHPKEFYERVVDITVWSVSLNSADAVANFMDQLEAADAMQMNGEVVGEVLGNQADVPNAQAFRIPVLNHRGEPSFLVVDRETYGEMIKAAKVSQASYAELAQKDARYAVHDSETRHRAFRPQLRENRATPESWVDQERDFILAEEVSRQRVAGLEAGTEADTFVAGQLDEAMERYRAQFNEFQMNFCRESRYRELALSRLTLRGVAGNAPDFERLLAQEMNAVALDYINRWNAFRAMTCQVPNLLNGNLPFKT